MKKFLNRYDKQVLLVWLFVSACLYAFIAVTTHNHYLTFGWDTGFFDQLIWQSSHFMFAFSSLNKVNILANHFSPILFLYAPLYWIWSDPRAILIAQAFVVVFAVYPLFLLSKELTKHTLFSFAVVFSYLFFLGTQWSILNEFHELTAAPIFIAITFYGLVKKKDLYFWIGIVGLLGTKEEMALLVASIGLTVAWFFKRKKLGYLLSVCSFAFFFFLTMVFMPAISEKGTYQHSHLSAVAKTPQEFTKKMFTDPVFVLTSLVTPAEKIETLVVSFVSFAFIPLFAPLGILIPVGEQFLMRFLYSGGQFTTWRNVNHHAAPIAMLLPIASVFASYEINKRLKIHSRKTDKTYLILACALVLATLAQDILLKAPIHSLLKPQFYETYDWMGNNDAMVEELVRISPQGPVAAQNSMHARISQRKDAYLLPEIADAEYLLVDFRDGPNKFAPLYKTGMKDMIDQRIAEGTFSIYKSQGDAMILVRNKIMKDND